MDELEAIVNDYIRTHRRWAAKELEIFSRQPSLEEAVRLAGQAVDDEEKRFPHQYRLTGGSLRSATSALLSAMATIGRCKDFDQLMNLISGLVGPTPGIGELTFTIRPLG